MVLVTPKRARDGVCVCVCMRESARARLCGEV